MSTLEREELARSIKGKYLKKYYPMMGNSINIKKEQSVSHKSAK